MWRLWTPGWGVRDWWQWVRREGLPLWIAFRLPRRVVYWAYIRVSASATDSPGTEFDLACKAWERGNR